MLMSKAVQPSHLRPCGWQTLLPPVTPRSTLCGDQVADLVVVGAGYTGVAVAQTYHSLAPDRRIVVLDAETVGEGSPGRNSGFMLEIALANDASADQLARMSTLNALSRQTMARLKAQVDEHDIDCQLQRTGTYRAARGDEGRRALARYQGFLDAAGLSYRRLDLEQLGIALGTRYYVEGLYSPDCYLVQPAALIGGLVDSLPEAIDCHERSPVLAVQRDKEAWRVSTSKGSVRAQQVVLANNAFSRALGADRSRLTAIYTYAALTARLDSDLTAAIGAEPWGLLPTHRLGCTLRTTADGRLMIRAQYSYERERDNAAVAAGLKSSLVARYPELAAVEFERVWGGTTGLTYNGAPLWGEVAENLFVSAGCNGGGIVKGTLLGDALARLALKQPTVDVPGLFGKPSWMPPEPIRRLAFDTIRTLEQRKGRDET